MSWVYLSLPLLSISLWFFLCIFSCRRYFFASLQVFLIDSFSASLIFVCTIVSLDFLPLSPISYLPCCLNSFPTPPVWTCPLEFRIGHGGYTKPIFCNQRNEGQRNAAFVPRSPTGFCLVSMSLCRLLILSLYTYVRHHCEQRKLQFFEHIFWETVYVISLSP